MNLLPTNLAPLAVIADQREGTRWATTGIQFESLKDGNGMPAGWRATATDTKRLVRITGPDVSPPETYPDLPGMTTAPNGAASALIPADRWESFFKSAAKLTSKKHLKPIHRTVALKIGESVATFGATDGDDKPLSQTKLVEGKFPPVDDIMPKKLRTGATVVHISPTLFSETLTAIAKMMNMEQSCHVRLEIFDQNKPIHLSAKGANGTEIESIIMPMGCEKGDPDRGYDPVGRQKKIIARLLKNRRASSADRSVETARQWRSKADELQAEVLALRAENERLKQTAAACRTIATRSSFGNQPAIEPIKLNRAERIAAMKT